MSASRNRTFRDELVAALPFVRELKHSHKCTATMYRSAAARERGCQNPARWRFTGKRRTVQGMSCPSGTYCWSHLMHHAVFGSMEDEERTEKALRAAGYLCSATAPYPPGRAPWWARDSGAEMICHRRGGHETPHGTQNSWQRLGETWTSTLVEWTETDGLVNYLPRREVPVPG